LAAFLEILANTPETFGSAFGDVVGAICSGAFQGFTWVTVIFALNERFLNIKALDAKKNWSVSDLPEIPKKEAIIKPVDPILGIVFSALFSIFFIFENHLIGIYNFSESKLISIIPLFSPEGIRRVIPWVVVIFIMLLMKEGIKLFTGRWNITVCAVAIITNIISLILSVLILKNNTIWNQSFLSELEAAGIGVSIQNINTAEIWNGVTKGLVYIIVFGYIIDSVVFLYRGIRYAR